MGREAHRTAWDILRASSLPRLLAASLRWHRSWVLACVRHRWQSADGDLVRVNPAGNESLGPEPGA